MTLLDAAIVGTCVSASVFMWGLNEILRHRRWWREVMRDLCECGEPAVFKAHFGGGKVVANFCRRCAGADF